VRFSGIHWVALEIGSPLAIHCDDHLKDLVGAVLLIPAELGKVTATEIAWMLSAFIGSSALVENKPGVTCKVTCIFVRQVPHSIHGHSIKGHVRGLRGIDSALMVAESVAVTSATRERIVMLR